MFHIKSIDYPHLFQNHDMGCIKQLTFKGPQVNAETYQGICGRGEKGGIYPPLLPPYFWKNRYTEYSGVPCIYLQILYTVCSCRQIIIKIQEVLCAFGLLYRF